MTPANKMRLLFAALAVSSTAYVGREGWKVVAYPDPVHGAAVPTYCAGLTGGGVKVGDKFTEEECLRLTMLSRVQHLVPILPCVRDDIPVNGRTESYLGVMATMSENIGVGRQGGDRGFLPSRMCWHMKHGDYRAACDAIKLYKYAGPTDCSDPANRTCRGLWTDRLKSHAACLEAIP
jgi:lysozyme